MTNKQSAPHTSFGPRKPWQRPASPISAPPKSGPPAKTQHTHTPAKPQPATGSESTSTTAGATLGQPPLRVDNAQMAPPRMPEDTADTARIPAAGSAVPLVQPHRSRPRRNKRGLFIAAVTFALVVTGSVVAGVWALGSMSSTPSASGPTTDRLALPQSAATGTPPAAVEPSPVGPADPPCPSATEGKVTTGDDEGDLVGGAEVIKRFNFAYYVWRSGARAHEVVAPQAQVGSIADLDVGIKSIPEGTTFCLSITDRGEGLWAVQLAHNTPNIADRKVWYQLVQTVEDQGRTWIVSIDQDKRKGQ